MKLVVALLTGMLVLANLSGAAEEPHEESGHHEESGDHEEVHAFTVDDFVRQGVTLVTAGPGIVDAGVDLPGEVRPNADRIAHIAPRFAGVVREVRAHVGDRVHAGSVLAIVESEHLAPFELRAAFDGTVIDKHIAPGEAIGHDDTAFIVADLSTVWVIINVYQEALPLVGEGRRVRIAAPHAGLEAEGTVSYVSPIVDQATRTAQARVVLPNADGRWRPGLFVTATVQDPVPGAVVVPRRAVQTLEGRPTVFVIDDDRFVPRSIGIGEEGRTLLSVTHGLAAGERIADAHSFLVKAELAKGAGGHDH